jgi:predicted acylesterase/phospholipase RssA
MSAALLGLLRERLAQDWLSREYVVLGPAGAHGGVMLGLVSGLVGDETGPKFREWRRRLKGAGGISIGCMFAVGIAMGIDMQRLRYLLNTFPFGTIFTEDIVGELSTPLSESLAKVIRGQEELGLGAGFMSGASLYAAADYVLASGGVSNKVTFAEFHEATGFDLRIVATDLKSMRPVLFSHEETPHTRIISAMVASMSIPIMFKPTRIKIKGKRGLHCIDGAIVDPFGVHLFPEQLKANKVFVICKNINLHTPHRTNSMSSVLMSTIMMAGMANLSFAHLPLHNFAFALVGIETGRDETQVASWAQLFDSPSTNEFVLDGIASVDNMALTHLVLVYAVLWIVGSSGSRLPRGGSEARPSPTWIPAADACTGSPPTLGQSHEAASARQPDSPRNSP